MTGPEQTYDLIVLGAGPVGENFADYAHRGGLSVAVVEAELIGGECSYWACMPSKALLRTPQAVFDARRLPGVRAEFDPAAVFARRDEVVGDWHDDGQQQWLEGAGIGLLRGVGRLTGRNTVAVTGRDGSVREVRARHGVAVCTGSTPVTPPIPGLDTVRPWYSRDVTSAEEAPARLGVLGGGVVGVEMAQAFARLGSRVTLIVRGALLATMEPVAGRMVADGLRADGVDVRTDSGLDSVAPGSGSASGSGSGAQDGPIELRIGGDTVTVDRLLVATGRRPTTADLGLDAVGLGDHAGGPLPVDDAGLVEGTDWLWAAGDVTGRAPLTHQGKYAARIAAATLAARVAGKPAEPTPWGEHAATADHAAVPQVVFTDPEVAFVGRTAERAAADGLSVRTVELDIAVAGSYVRDPNYTGRVVAAVDTEREVLVGVTFVGPEVAELLHAATIAVVGEVPLSRLWHAVPAFPTVSEVWLRLLEAYRAP